MSFLLMWASVAASGFGDRLIQLAAKPMLGVYQDVSVARVEAAIAFFFFAPYLVFSVIGGWIADRLPRKWVMLGCDEARALILLGAFLMAGQLVIPESEAGEGLSALLAKWNLLGETRAIPTEHHWKIYLIMALTGTFAAIFSPARQSTVPQIVRTRDLQQANAVLAGIAMIASLVGVLAGGPLVENLSVRLGILVGILAFGISGLFFAFLKVRPHVTAPIEKPPPFVAQMLQALSYIHRHGAVRALVILNILFWSAVWFVNAAIAVLNKTRYDVPAEGFITAQSNMLGMVGLGMILASGFVLWLKERRESDIVAMFSLVLTGVCMLLLAWTDHRGFALFLTLAIGFFGGVFFIIVDTLTQLLTPNYLRGRVFGLRGLLNTVSAVVINYAIWRLPEAQADQLMIPSLYLTAAVLLAVALLALQRNLVRGPMADRVLNLLWHLCRLYTFAWHRLTVIGKANVPRQGPVLLASNHTTGLDPSVIQAGVPRPIRWIMLTSYEYSALNFLWRQLRPIALERGSGDVAKLRQILQALKEGDVVGIFPEGRLQREHRELGPFEPGVGMLARRSDAMIVPVWVHGTPRTRNMLWHFLRMSRTTVIFGEAYQPDPKAKPEAIVEDLRRRMLELKEQVEGGRAA